MLKGVRLAPMGLVIGMWLGGCAPAGSQESDSAWQQALEWAGAQDLLKESLFPEAGPAPVLESGQYLVRLSIHDAWMEFPVEIDILGSYRGAPARLAYRTVALLGTREQLALQHLGRVAGGQEILSSDWLIEDLSFGEKENPSFDPVVLMHELTQIKVPVLPMEPGSITVDPTSYILEFYSGPGSPSVRCLILGGLFHREELIIKDGAGGHPDPFVSWLQRLYVRLHSEWKKRMSEAGYRQLLDRIDLKRDGAMWFGGACVERWSGFTHALLRAGLDLNRPGPDGVPPLVAAAGSGDTSLLLRFLSGGVSPNVTATSGETPLMRAARSGSFAMVKMLLANGARLHAQTAAGGYSETALDCAVESGSVDLVRFLLERGARQAKGDVETPPLLFWAINHDDPALLALLVEYGWSVHQAYRGLTPLAHAVEGSRLKAVRLLLDRGARVDAKDMSKAVERGDDELVTLLKRALQKK
ncbi:MAG: ankyrin repeat domain-containing protein [Acidobacteriota bacterium]